MEGGAGGIFVINKLLEDLRVLQRKRVKIRNSKLARGVDTKLVGRIVIKTVKVLILLFLVGFTIAFSFWFGQRVYKIFWDLPAEVEVPNIVGEDASVADNLLKEKGLVLTIVDSRYQDKYPSNTIIKQDPPAGIMVRKGREILAVVSLGPELMEVPNLKGLSLRESKVLLGNNKLRVGKIKKVTKSFAEPGEILDQTPLPGEKIKVGSKVDLTINRGDEPMVRVPNLVGKKLSEAEKILDSSLLRLGTVVWVWHDYIPRGEIIRQIPSPKSLAEPRTRVDVKVSAGQRGFDLNLKQRKLVIFAPKGEGLQTIKVRQVDDFGDRIVYEGKHAPGGNVALTIYSWGDTEIQIYYNTKLVKRMRF